MQDKAFFAVLVIIDVHGSHTPLSHTGPTHHTKESGLSQTLHNAVHCSAFHCIGMQTYRAPPNSIPVLTRGS